jgi:VanZ family protein
VSDVRSAGASAPSALTRRHYAWLGLGLALFIVYGSLVPFDYHALPWAEALVRFREVLSVPLGIGSGPDWLANCLVAVPLGFFLMGALCADRGPLSSLAVLVVLPACLALSTSVEFAQLWFARTSSLYDIIAQFTGATFGAAVWLAFGQRITRWGRGVWLTVGTQGLAARLLPGYLALLVFVYGQPFDLTLSPVDLWHKWRDGRIILVPFRFPPEVTLYAGIEKHCWTVALFLPLGLLLGNVRHPAVGRARGWPFVFALALGATLAVQCLKLMVQSRWVDATEVVIGSLAVVAGWALALALRHRRLAVAASGRLPDPRLTALRRGLLIGLLLLTWLAVAVLVNWQPFDFRFDADYAAERWRHVSLLPFTDYLADYYLNALDQLIKKVLLFVPLGALLTLSLPSTLRTRGALVVLAAAALAAAFEAGQLLLPTRYTSITDVLVETSGAWVGFILTRRAQWLLAPPPVAQAGYGGPSSSAVARAPIHIHTRG